MPTNSSTWLFPLIMLTAIATAAWMLKRSQQGLPLSNRHKSALGIGAFCGAMLGSKLPFALSDWDGLSSGVVWFSSGKTIVCGMVGAYFGVELTKWIFRIRVKTGDSYAVPVAVAVGIGRIGCLVAGCCFGTPTTLPWGICFSLAEPADVPRHPTQIYESLFHFGMAGLLSFLRHRSVWRGQLIKFYILCYLAYRWLSEFIRPEPDWWLSMTAYQWFALAMMPLFLFLWWLDRRTARAGVVDGNLGAAANVP